MKNRFSRWAPWGKKFSYFYLQEGHDGPISLTKSILCYIRHLSYCFYIAVNRICVAISRVDGALKLWSSSWQLQTKTCIPGFACSSYVKSASAAWAEEIITMIQRPKWRCSSLLWSMESMTRHKRSHGHPLHPGLAPDVLTLSCLWIQLGQDERVRLTLHTSPSL